MLRRRKDVAMYPFARYQKLNYINSFFSIKKGPKCPKTIYIYISTGPHCG